MACCRVTFILQRTAFGTNEEMQFELRYGITPLKNDTCRFGWFPSSCAVIILSSNSSGLRFAIHTAVFVVFGKEFLGRNYSYNLVVPMKKVRLRESYETWYRYLPEGLKWLWAG